jgi:hypothetical protein
MGPPPPYLSIYVQITPEDSLKLMFERSLEIFACCYLFLPLCFALLLFIPSFVFLPYSYFFFPSHFTLLPTYSLFHVSPYYYMFLPLGFTLLLPVLSFVHYLMTTCFLLCVSLCYLPTHSHFIMLLLSRMLML